MATKVYTGVSNIAQRVRKIYIGVDGVAQKVRKGYIGVAGVARQFFASSKKIVFKQTKLLSSARYDLGAAKAGDYAVFGPGRTGHSTYGGNYDAYDSSLTLTTISTEGEDVPAGYGAASVGNYAIFAGGVSDAGISSKDYRIDTCTAIDKYLTKAELISVLSDPKSDMGVANIGGYALFAGGSNRNPCSSVDAFDSSLTKTTATDLYQARSSLAGASTKDYAVFLGGYNNGASDRIDRYDASLTRSTGFLPGSATISGHAAASVGKYAVFAGQSAYSVNNSGTVSAITSLSQARRFLTATAFGDYAVFAGGSYGDNVYTNIDTYDTSLTRESKISLSLGRHNLASVTIGDYALFGGGDILNSLSSAYATNAVDIYELTE